MKDEIKGNEKGREQFLTARQLASVLQVSETTVRRLAQQGRIPAIRLTPRLTRFHLQSVCEALNGDGATARNTNARSRRQTEASDGRQDSQLSFLDDFNQTPNPDGRA